MFTLVLTMCFIVIIVVLMCWWFYWHYLIREFLIAYWLCVAQSAVPYFTHTFVNTCICMYNTDAFVFVKRFVGGHLRWLFARYAILPHGCGFEVRVVQYQTFVSICGIKKFLIKSLKGVLWLRNFEKPIFLAYYCSITL